MIVEYRAQLHRKVGTIPVFQRPHFINYQQRGFAKNFFSCPDFAAQLIEERQASRSRQELIAITES